MIMIKKFIKKYSQLPIKREFNFTELPTYPEYKIKGTYNRTKIINNYYLN